MNTSIRSTNPLRILADFGKVLDAKRYIDSRLLLKEARECSLIDVFFSHVWGSNAKIRYLGVLWHVNAIKSAIGTVIFTVLTCLILSFVVVERQWYAVEANSKLSIQSITAIYGTLMWLVLFKYLQNVLSVVNFPARHCFLDRCCIDQVNDAQKEKGVSEIPYILQHSTRLVILLSDDYFDRLWCCYELAVFRSSMGPNASVSFVPLRLIFVSILMMFLDLVSILLFTSDIRLQVANNREVVFQIVSVAFSLATASLAYIFAYIWFGNLRRFELKLGQFALAETLCSEPKDRAWLTADIEHRFNGLEKFEKYVQTELRAEIGTNRPKLKYLWIISLPTLLATMAFIVILPQRMGLFCLSEFEHTFVTKDFGLCAILDRSRALNYLVIASGIVRFICYYPVIIQLFLLLCQLASRVSTNPVLKWTIHASGVICAAVLVYSENKGYGEDNLHIYHLITSCVTGAMFTVLYILPGVYQNWKYSKLHPKHH